MEDYIRRARDFYERKPGARIIQREFGYYSAERWIREGHISSESELQTICRLDPSAWFDLTGLGWCEAGLSPEFETRVLEDLGDYELVQDFAGRQVLYFKGRRNGFMPEYRAHPVTDMASLEREIAWRMDPASPARWTDIENTLKEAAAAQKQGKLVRQKVVGGFMYLRSLMGVENLLFAFYDDPALIHRAMELWLKLADAVCARHQKAVNLDEVFLAEDICYNHGPLISPDMMREFLIPYYQQLLENCRRRQLEPGYKFHVQVDTDGDCRPVMDVYREGIGLDFMSPLEMASGCDPVEIREKYPDLLLSGGFDKRILARGRDAIAREVDRILPFMTAWGGYYPTCDHGVPEEVSFEDYVYFRELLHQY